MDTKTLFAPQNYGGREKAEALACLLLPGGEG
jgi:hypothetical protein